MIDPKQIPDAVVEAAFRAWWANGARWPDVIAAALAAWPGARHDKLPGHVREYLILPLPQEAPQERINQESSDDA